MKRIVLVTLAFCLSQITYSQTNTFPATGNVGIGTTNPRVKLNPVVTSHNESPTLGSANGGFLLGEISNNYGLLMGIGNSGNTWMQVQRVDGTATAYNLVLQPNGGNVGIGITNPRVKLNPVVTSHNESPTLGSASGGFLLGEISNNYGLLMGIGNSGNTWMQVQRVDGTATAYNLVLQPLGGNIGIGTTNPQSILDVRGDININSGIDDNHIYWGSHNMTMGTKPGDYAHNIFSLKPGGASQGKLVSVFKMYSANSISNYDLKVQIHSDGTTFFNGGNVGIGTTTPQNKLDVAGTIRCTEVKVEALPWADFVFHPTYKLRTLGEVEQFIKTNNHLPEIPTESEVKENGVGLGEMNAKLLQKVEELTLYLIEQQKKIQELEIQNQRINKLEEKLNEVLNK